MSILIKGMEMPKDKEISLRIDEKGEVYVYGSYPTELYKAVPIPPHGRLIDADALPTYDKPIGKMMMFGGEYVYTQSEIANVPTIIEAEEVYGQYTDTAGNFHWRGTHSGEHKLKVEECK